MYKNMYKSKIILLLLSSIATMLAEIQDENKKWRQAKPRELKRMVKLFIIIIIIILSKVTFLDIY